MPRPLERRWLCPFCRSTNRGPKRRNGLIRTRMNMVWKLGRRRTRSHWPWTQGRWKGIKMALRQWEPMEWKMGGTHASVCDPGSQFRGHLPISLLGTSAFSAHGTHKPKVTPPPHGTEKEPWSHLAYGSHSSIPYPRLAQPAASRFCLTVLGSQHGPFFPF